MGADIWVVRLSAASEADFRQILRWTLENFGAMQARIYADTLLLALRALNAGPEIIGVNVRDDIGAAIRTLHVARQGRKGRHFVLFQVNRVRGTDVIDVLRLLHDSMDLARHVPLVAPD